MKQKPLCFALNSSNKGLEGRRLGERGSGCLEESGVGKGGIVGLGGDRGVREGKRVLEEGVVISREEEVIWRV